jgi:hypothetical protein
VPVSQISIEVKQTMRFVVYDTGALHNFAVACAARTGQLDAFLEQHDQYTDNWRTDGEAVDPDGVALNDIDWLCERGLAFDQDESQGFAWCETKTEFL